MSILTKAFTLGIVFGAGLWLLGWPPALEGTVTQPDEPIIEKPADLILPGDFPLPVTGQTLQNEGLKILVFGDGGTGDEIQFRVAKAMKEFCSREGCHLALMLGDNIHPAGVASVNDPQFLEKFEKPYAPLGLPIFAILGEHDWGRKGNMYNWRAQIDYTKKSKYWRMPSDVYSLTIGEVKIIALNTNYFPNSKIQKDWLKKQLETTPARWNLVMGHKPIFSYGYHGDTDFMVQDVLPLLCGKADLYLAGHEHKQQVLKADCGLTMVVSASAGKLRQEPETGPRALFNLPEPGFAHLWIKKNELIVRILSDRGEVRYQMVIPKTPGAGNDRSKKTPAEVGT
jgi:tartrate-resistant acid phosphatase type 5